MGRAKKRTKEDIAQWHKRRYEVAIQFRIKVLDLWNIYLAHAEQIAALCSKEELVKLNEIQTAILGEYAYGTKHQEN